MYSCDDGLVNIKDIGNLLNIQVSRCNKAILEVNRSNTLMAGFPDYSLHKFVNILVDNNFTTVVVSQVSPPPKPRRAVTQVVSPGTYINNPTAEYVSNVLMSIYIEDIAINTIVIGVSLIDLSTGSSKSMETCSKQSDQNYPLDEAYRLISIYNPKEIIIFGTTKHTTLIF